jgi:hypothetical protein
MMIDCVLRANGWDSSVLGAATSPLRMNQYLQDLGPEAVAVSCSVLGALPATRRVIEASTASGVPILVGGPAFGIDDIRAVALGATAWASDAQGAVAAMDRMPAVVPPASPLPADAAAEQAALQLDHQRLVGLLRERWSLTVDGPGDTALVKAVVVTDDVLTQLLHAISAVLLTGDPRPVPETVWWIADLLHTRGAGLDVVHELGGLLTRTLRDYPLAHGIVTRHFDEGLADFA